MKADISIPNPLHKKSVTEALNQVYETESSAMEPELVKIQMVSVGDTFIDMIQASRSSLDFWDNPLDDEDWNTA